MSNLRWIVRDGKEVLQSGWTDGKFVSWDDVPLVVSEPPKKSLAQVLYEVEQEALGYHLGWENTYGQIKRIYEDKAKAAISYLEKEGWRKP